MADVGRVSSEDLVLKYLGYAQAIATKLAKNLPIETEDAVSAAHEGLVLAAQRFDFDRWDPALSSFDRMFKSAAYLRIAGAIIDQVRKDGFTRRRGYEKGLKVNMVPLEKLLDLEGPGGDWAARTDLDIAFSNLEQREREILVGYMSGYTGQELSERMGITASRISQIGKRARAKVAEQIAT